MKAFALAAAIAVVFMTNPGQAQTRPDEFASGAYTVVSSNAWAPVYSNDVRSFAPSLLGGFDVEEGWRFNRYYAVEAGYALATGSSQYIRLTVQAVSLDALGYLPFGYHRKFALFGDVGVSELRGTASTSVYGLDVSESSNSFGARFGGGFQFQFNETLGVRASIRYQFANFSGVKGAAISTVGLVWHPW